MTTQCRRNRIAGGEFLQVLGFWMVPVGLVLLAQDVPPLRGPIGKAINWADRKWPSKQDAK
jgi:hypothetical protein